MRAVKPTVTTATIEARSEAQVPSLFILSDVRPALTGGRSGGIGKAFGGFAGSWIGFQETIGVG